jgi:integrase
VGSANPTPRTVFEPTSPTLAKYMNYLLSKRTLKPSTVKRKVKLIKSLLKHNVELSNPNNVLSFLNSCNWASGTKDILIDSYRDYLDMMGLTNIKLPHIRREYKLPFIPLEHEIDALIFNARIKMSCFLRILKDTGCRPIEAWCIKWTDIDLINRTVTITPAKYSRPRKLRISEQTINLLTVLPKNNTYVFSPSGNKERFSDELQHFSINFMKLRERVSRKLNNPRIKMISLRTFRHWKGTVEYIRTKDIVHVKELLGHVNINNTLTYVHLANAVSGIDEEYICKVARNVNEAKALIESGFDYVTEINGVLLFRKRK